MACPNCGAPVQTGAGTCAACGAVTRRDALGVTGDELTSLGSSSPAEALTTQGPATEPVTSAGTGPLRPGTPFGSRYQLIRLLGMGGMGAVYQAWDDELGVAVALKVIRPEITADPAAARDFERRFKQELLLARQVTHKHVVRIHDLGEIDGVKRGRSTRTSGRTPGGREAVRGRTRDDAQFALAYSKRAQALAKLGRSANAEIVSRQAVNLSDRLPAEERDLIEGTHAQVVNDLDKAIESYGRLAEARPGDVQIAFDLGALYESKGVLDRARDEYAKVIAADPKYGDALYAAGRVAIKRGDYQRALDSLNVALSLSIQLDKPEFKATVLQALGIAYKNLGKLEEALDHYRQSLAIKERIQDKRGIAASLAEIAQIYELQGRPDEARESAIKSLEIKRALGDKRGVAITLNSMGVSYMEPRRGAAERQEDS
jgi:tetratricopeptide (TPR) repeat protein